MLSSDHNTVEAIILHQLQPQCHHTITHPTTTPPTLYKITSNALDVLALKRDDAHHSCVFQVVSFTHFGA